MALTYDDRDIGRYAGEDRARGLVDQAKADRYSGATGKLRKNCITAADMIVADLLFTGAIEPAEADELMRGWIETYARELLQGAPLPQRLQALWRRGDVADFLPQLERVQMIGEASRVVAAARAQGVDGGPRGEAKGPRQCRTRR